MKYPNESNQIFKALIADEISEKRAFDVKFSLFTKNSPNATRFINAMGYSNEPRWLANDLINQMLSVKNYDYVTIKFISSRDTYLKDLNEATQ